MADSKVCTCNALPVPHAHNKNSIDPVEPSKPSPSHSTATSSTAGTKRRIT
jgi:hypothetical protein